MTPEYTTLVALDKEYQDIQQHFDAFARAVVNPRIASELKSFTAGGDRERLVLDFCGARLVVFPTVTIRDDRPVRELAIAAREHVLVTWSVNEHGEMEIGSVGAKLQLNLERDSLRILSLHSGFRPDSCPCSTHCDQDYGF